MVAGSPLRRAGVPRVPDVRRAQPDTGALVELNKRVLSGCIVQSPSDRVLSAVNPDTGAVVELKNRNVRVRGSGCIVQSLSDRVLYVVNPKTGSTAQLKDQNIRVIW